MKIKLEEFYASSRAESRVVCSARPGQPVVVRKTLEDSRKYSDELNKRASINPKDYSENKGEGDLR